LSVVNVPIAGDKGFRPFNMADVHRLPDGQFITYKMNGFGHFFLASPRKCSFQHFAYGNAKRNEVYACWAESVGAMRRRVSIDGFRFAPPILPFYCAGMTGMIDRSRVDWRREIPAFAGMTGWGGNDGDDENEWVGCEDGLLRCAAHLRGALRNDGG
jgi:hypothetical protein